MKRTDFLDRLASAKRIVIKIGSSNLVEDPATVNDFLFDLVSDIKMLYGQGKQFVLVSSGAVAKGKSAFEMPSGAMQDMAAQQALAAIGQNRLLNTYDHFFSTANIPIAQILLSTWDLGTAQAIGNLRMTFDRLLEWGVLPIVNENDSTATRELKFGDNDIMSAMVALMVDADVSIMLTNVDGYLKNGILQDYLDRVSSGDYENTAGKSTHGTGGMFTKLKAASILSKAGRIGIIAKAHTPSVIQRVLGGDALGTLVGDLNHDFNNRNDYISGIFQRYVLQGYTD